MKRLALATSALVALAASAGAQVIPPGTNPVPAAGAYNSSPPTLTSGQAGWLQLDSAGNLRISGTVTTALSGSTSNASSGVATSATNVPTVSYNYGFNGTAWDQLQVDASKFLKVTLGSITPTDRTITSASGSSQQIMAANASRHSLTIENTGNANCGINPTGGTAAIGGVGTITLAPLGSYTPRVPTLSAVTVICTATQPIYGDEN